MQEDEEEIQMQSEEEELQMQEDEEEIQMQGEEEELQMQEDEEEIQMQSEEEELQMQEEEEEVQMQPDAGGVVQRGITDWFKKKKKDAIPEAPEFTDVKPVTPRGKPLTAKGQQVLDTIKATKPSSRTMQEQIASKAKHMGSSDTSSTHAKHRLARHTKKIEGEQAHRFERDVQGVDTKKMVQVSQKENLVRTLKNPNATEQERQEAESQLREFHKSGAFKKNPATVALDERRKLLKEKAKSGDKNAMDLYRKEKAPSFLSKAKGFYGKHQETFGKIGSAIGSFAGKALGVGGSEKSEEKGGGGGGDGGGYAVIISQLMQENKMLKEQLGKK